MLSTVVDGHPQTWESHLRAVCMAYNTSIQPTTGYSPFLLMFGRKARLPIDIVYGTAQPDNLPVDSFVNDMSVVLENAYQHVRNTMGVKQDRQKEFYDHKRHGEFYQAGDLVWLILLLSLVEHLESFIDLGQDHIRSSRSWLMSLTEYKIVLVRVAD